MASINQSFTILPSAARTTAQSVDLTNDRARGVYITIDVTVDAATGSITPSVAIIDPVSGAAETIALMTALAAVTRVTLLIYPGTLTAAANDITQILQAPLPRDWRFVMAVADTDSLTYSVGAMYVK